MTSEEYSIIYGLKLFEGSIKFYYPEVCIAKNNKGMPAYMYKIGTREVIDSFNFPIKNTIHEELIKICHECSPSYIEQKHQSPKSKFKPINSLFENESFKSTIIKKIEKDLVHFLELIKKNRVTLYFEIARSIHLNELMINLKTEAIQPILRFEKTALGTNYSMAMELEDQKRFYPHEKQMFHIITYNPATVIIDYSLYDVNNIDGKKIIPFLSKEKIFIEERTTAKYFNTFIKDIIGKAEVEVQGFLFTEHNQDPVGTLSFGHAFDDDSYELIPYFNYNNIKFIYGNKQDYRIKIETNEANKIEVHKFNRNFEKENSLLKIFEDLSFVRTAAFRFKKSDTEDGYESLTFVINNKEKFEKYGWKIEFPNIKNSKLNLEKFQMNAFKYSDQNDWFDVHAEIWIGQHLIKFSQIVNHIKKNDRILKLEDGTVFIIPFEWLSKLQNIVKYGNLKNDKVEIPKTAFAMFEDINANSETGKSIIITDEDFDFKIPKQLNANLRTYQLEGAKWLVKHYKNGMGACLSDDMGLGKTIQTITALLHAKDNMELVLTKDIDKPIQLSLFENNNTIKGALRALIVMPSSLIYNWEIEFIKFAPSLKIVKHTGPDRNKDLVFLKNQDVVLTSYNLLLKDKEYFSKLDLQYLVIDESHYIKNRDSKIFKTLSEIKCDNRISLSGTPIENSLADLWSQMQFINPNILGSYSQFKKMYQDPIEKEKSEGEIVELKKLLQPFILRRTKKEVLEDLPDYEETIFYSEMTEQQAQLHETEKSKARNQILEIAGEDEKVNKLHVFNYLSRLRQISCHPAMVSENSESGKYNDVTETLDSLLKTDNKILIFSSYIIHLEIYKKYFNSKKIKFSMLTGEDNAKEKEAAINKFNNNDDVKIMMLTIKAGGVGLNLTSANYVLILDPWWNPFAEQQAIGRAHRIGQKQKVNVIKFISKNSIEEKIEILQKKKLLLSDSILDYQQLPDMNEEVLEYIFQ